MSSSWASSSSSDDDDQYRNFSSTTDKSNSTFDWEGASSADEYHSTEIASSTSTESLAGSFDDATTTYSPRSMSLASNTTFDSMDLSDFGTDNQSLNNTLDISQDDEDDASTTRYDDMDISIDLGSSDSSHGGDEMDASETASDVSSDLFHSPVSQRPRSITGYPSETSMGAHSDDDGDSTDTIPPSQSPVNLVGRHNHRDRDHSVVDLTGESRHQLGDTIVISETDDNIDTSEHGISPDSILMWELAYGSADDSTVDEQFGGPSNLQVGPYSDDSDDNSAAGADNSTDENGSVFNMNDYDSDEPSIAPDPAKVERNTITYTFEGRKSNGPNTTTTEDENCSICIAEFVLGDNMRRLRCFHQFHVTCIDGWLNTKTICPICRTGIFDKHT